MQPRRPMIAKKKRINRVLQSVAAAMSAIPYMKSRQRHRMLVRAYVLGGIGFAIAGGVAALLFFSPRTRHRALDVAKNTYGKVNDRIGHRHAPSMEPAPMSNGLVEGEYSPTTSATSGL